MEAIIRTNEPVYYLLGEDLANAYHEGGVEMVLEQARLRPELDLELTTITDGMRLDVALDLIDGYFGFAHITAADYTAIWNYINPPLETI